MIWMVKFSIGSECYPIKLGHHNY
ncbi:hypothetical protein THIOKS12950012 [Thiocapsa sp. KS1]|nr:hypothetical protein THIOKS12950012 [Thiocapsa sp. KS1]